MQPVVPTLYSAFQSDYEISSGPNEGDYITASLAQAGANHREAAEHFLAALERDPDNIHVAERAFFELVYTGRMEKAAEIARKLARDPAIEQNDLAVLVYVLEPLRAKDYSEAIKRASLAGETGFGYILKPILSAWAQAGLGDMQAAKGALAPLLENERLSIIAEEHLAYMLDYAGKTPEAMAAYKAFFAEGQRPTGPMVLSYADFLSRHREKELLSDLLDQQSRRFSGNNEVLRELYLISIGRGTSRSIGSPQEGAASVFMTMAQELAAGPNLQVVLVYMRLAEYILPHAPGLKYALADLNEKLDDPEGAIEIYQSIPQQDPYYRFAQLRQIDLLSREGESLRAEALINEGLLIRPEDVELLTRLASLRRVENRCIDAIPLYTQALANATQNDQNQWAIYFARAICLEQIGEWPKAEADLQRALRLSPQQAEVLNALGYGWIDRGYNIKQAKNMIEAAVQVEPNNGFIIDSLGWVHYLTGDYDLAVGYLEQAVSIEPDDPEINAHLGDAYWKVGRRIEARFKWQHALEQTDVAEDKVSLKAKLADGLREHAEATDYR